MGLSPMRPGAKAERGLKFEDNDRSDGVANPLPAKLNWCGNFRDYQGNAVVVINLVASTKGIYWAHLAHDTVRSARFLRGVCVSTAVLNECCAGCVRSLLYKGERGCEEKRVRRESNIGILRKGLTST
jgi:hypothetical protein